MRDMKKMINVRIRKIRGGIAWVGESYCMTVKELASMFDNDDSRKEQSINVGQYGKTLRSSY